jgi:prepilin-type N-terminal cleavage/methylation domain-containing protein
VWCFATGFPRGYLFRTRGLLPLYGQRKCSLVHVPFLNLLSTLLRAAKAMIRKLGSNGKDIPKPVRAWFVPVLPNRLCDLLGENMNVMKPSHRSETGHTIVKLGHGTFAPRRYQSSRGLTLVEVLVALAFLGVFAVGMTGLAVAIVNGNARSQSMDIAVHLALDKLETIRNTPYANITTANFQAEGYGSIAVGSASFPDFVRSVAIQNDTPTTGMSRVIVTVGSRKGISVSEEMVVGR